MRNELRKIIICASVGFIIGLIIGINNSRQSGLFSPFLTPIIGAFFVIGVVYGAKTIVKLLRSTAKFMGSVTRMIITIISRGGWIIVILGIIAIIFVGYWVLIVFVCICWIPGVFIAGKALLDAKRGDVNSPRRSESDEWDDDNFNSGASSWKRNTSDTTSKKENNNGRRKDDWDIDW